MQRQNRGRAGALVLALTGLGGCSGSVEGAAPGLGVGTVEAHWTIEGSADPAKCTEHGAIELHIVVFDPAGIEQATERSRCDVFRTTMTIRPGLYTAEAVFQGPNGHPASGILEIPTFAVETNRAAILPMAFSAELMKIRQRRLRESH